MPKRTPSRSTPSRKKQHVELTLRRDVSFQRKTTGLERLDFQHNALPELNLSDVDPSTEFLGKRLSLPLMVASMTGGYADALTINRRLAEVCEEAGIALGVGSQRQALEDSRFHRTFSVVREVAGSIPVVGNIGAAEVARMTTVDSAKQLVDLIRADALAIHLNPLQELLQPEGIPEFRGVLAGIERLVRGLPVPVIVKEIGAGLSSLVVRQLLDVGVRIIDIAGAGGTSWAGVEILRRKEKGFAAHFWDWGIPTALAIRDAATLRASGRSFTLIASGGVNSGLDGAKSIALGADMIAIARPMLQALAHHRKNGALSLLQQWRQEFTAAMFLTGSRTIRELQHARFMDDGSHDHSLI